MQAARRSLRLSVQCTSTPLEGAVGRGEQRVGAHGGGARMGVWSGGAPNVAAAPPRGGAEQQAEKSRKKRTAMAAL